MKNYPNKVYLSTSWKNADKPLSYEIIKFLMNEGLTIIGDHIDNKKKDPVKRAWTTRISKLVSDCSALIIVFPKEETKQTTSPYMFPELLAADAHSIPILIFNQHGVLIKKSPTNLGDNIHFGGAKRPDKFLTHKTMFVNYNDDTEIDKKLVPSSSLKLINKSIVDGPYELVGNNVNIEQVISNFTKKNIKRIDGAFVFNIIPFSLKDKEHPEIAKAVFEETGLQCQISLDTIGESQDMRTQWKNTLSKSEFVIAEFSQLRDTCLFEAGVVKGMNKNLFLVAKKTPPLPYGLDNKPLKIYKSMSDLRLLVKRDCKNYKCKVYNLDKSYTLSVKPENKQRGIPEWYYENNNSTSPVTKLIFSLWFFSFSLGLLVWLFFIKSGQKDTPASLLSLSVGVIGILTSNIKTIQLKIESKCIRFANPILWVTSIIFLISIMFVCITT